MSLINVLRNISSISDGLFSLKDKFEPNKKNIVGVMLNSKGKTKYVVSDPKGDEALSVRNVNMVIEPFIPLRKDRFIIALSGESGSGKGTITAILCEQYKKVYPKHKIFYICNTPKEDDINLNKQYIHQIAFEMLHDITIKDLSNSLVIIDDMDNSEYSKDAKRVLNIIVETGRKYGVSLIFISHINTHGKDTTISKETDLYITNRYNIKNNRMISHYLGIPDHIFTDALHYNPVYVAINKQFRAIITDKTIYKY